jgi:pyridoxine 4-dehydrogenase
MQLFEASPEDAAAVLRRAVELGVNHIDTASFYGPGEVNRRIRAALAPYPDDLVIASKVGARYTGEHPIPLTPAQKPAELRAAVEDDLSQLGLERVPVVNLRRMDLGPGVTAEGDQIVDLHDQLAEMIALRDEGKIGAIGVSSVPLDVVRRALPAGIVCVQNAYSVLDRSQEATLDLCVAEGIAWVPFFPVGVVPPGFPQGRRRRGGGRGRPPNRLHASPSRTGVAVGPRAEHVADSRHTSDRAPRGEHRRGRRLAERGCDRAAGRRRLASGP